MSKENITPVENEQADVQTNPTQDKVAETAIANTESKPPVNAAQNTTYIAEVLANMMNDFIQVNDGMDIDFVYMGQWLVTDKKGNFVERDDPNVSYGDSIDVVVGQGEKRWSLWGLQNSPEDGQLIVACREKEEAVAQLTAWLAEHPEAAERYSVDDLELRYMAFVVPVNAIAESLNDPDVLPRVYIMSFAPTTTISWGRYAFNIYNGKYKAVGVKARTPVSGVVTRMTTKEFKSKTDASVSWLGIEFEAMGMFNPDDFRK